VARHDFVAYELLELRHGDLQTGVDFVGGFVLRTAVRVAGATQVVHRTENQASLMGREFNVGPRYGRELLGQIRQQVGGAEAVKVGDHGGPEARTEAIGTTRSRRQASTAPRRPAELVVE